MLFALSESALGGSWQQNRALGGFNNVHVYTPDSISPVGTGRALLLVLHGCTQSIDAFLNAKLEQAAETHGMVVAVPDAMNKAGFSCWSYWQGAISRNSGDYANLINLAQTLTADPSKAIDANQVYISGLSSGASFAAQTGCVAPDIFAGVAPSAGPTIGTSSSGAIGSCESVSPAQFESRCRSYANAAVESFLDSQIAVIAQGTADTTVSTCYNRQNANGYAQTYGVTQLPGTITIDDTNANGSGTAEQTLWLDNRVAMLWFDGLGHVWSGGSGASGSFIGGTSINFAAYLGEFFAANNPRINRNEAPQISGLSALVNNNALTISGTATDADGTVDHVEIAISDINNAMVEVEVLLTGIDGSGQFSATSAPLLDALYEITAVAIDDCGQSSAPIAITERIGEPPPEQAPTIDNLGVVVDGQCATVTGTVVDANQNLDTLVVDFESEARLVASVSADLNGRLFAAAACNLPGGTVDATATAIDSTALASTASIRFAIDAGQTGDFNFHIDEGHITWGIGFANCFLAFGNDSFTMRESAAGGGQCIWTADGDASCQGPAQACSGAIEGDPPAPNPDPVPAPEPDVQCQQFTTMNYLHRAAGRAYSTGNFWAPDYFAAGSDDPMPGSTYGTNTLSGSDGTNWSVMSCP
ncbi:MAG: PHB depolymerase family esterase [Wenzhouxiangellaceae bacterium]